MQPTVNQHFTEESGKSMAYRETQIGLHTYDSGYTKIACHYNDMTKEEYATMLRHRVNNFVVVNKRIMNPVDELDKHSYFLWITNPEGEMVACVRIIPNHHAYKIDPIRKYVIWDRAWIIDATVSLFPIPEFSNANAYIWTPEWVKRKVGCANALMDMYEDTHGILLFFQKYMPGLKYVKSEPDEWGYDGHKWVYEEMNLHDAEPIIRKFIEQEIAKEHTGQTTG